MQLVAHLVTVDYTSPSRRVPASLRVPFIRDTSTINGLDETREIVFREEPMRDVFMIEAEFKSVNNKVFFVKLEVTWRIDAVVS